MLGMPGGGENMIENLSGCLFTLGISLHKGTGGGGRQNLSQSEAGVFQWCASQCSSTQTAELAVILTA